MGLEAAELARWTRFAAKGGIGKCVALCDCVAESADDLMFLKDDDITVLFQIPDRDGLFLGYCEGVVGQFNGSDVRFLTRLKKPVMTKRSSVSATSTSNKSPSPAPGSVSVKPPSPSPTTPSSRPSSISRKDASSQSLERRGSSTSMAHVISPLASQPQLPLSDEQLVRTRRQPHMSYSSISTLESQPQSQMGSPARPGFSPVSVARHHHKTEGSIHSVTSTRDVGYPPHPSSSSSRSAPPTRPSSPPNVSVAVSVSVTDTSPTQQQQQQHRYMSLAPSPLNLIPDSTSPLRITKRSPTSPPASDASPYKTLIPLSPPLVPLSSPSAASASSQEQEQDTTYTYTTYQDPSRRLSLGMEDAQGIGLSLLQDMMNGGDSDSDEDSEGNGRWSRSSKYSGDGLAGGDEEGLRRVGHGPRDSVVGGQSQEGTVEGLGYALSEEEEEEDEQTELNHAHTPNQQHQPLQSVSASNARYLSPTTSPTSPSFPTHPSPNIDIAARTRRPSLAPSSTSAASTGSWEGASDIYDDYRYSRYSVASKMSRFSTVMNANANASGSGSGMMSPTPTPPVPEGRPSIDSTMQMQRSRVDSGSSVSSSARMRMDSHGHGHILSPRSLPQVLESPGPDVEGEGEGEGDDGSSRFEFDQQKEKEKKTSYMSLKKKKEKTMSVDSDASVYTQNSRLSTVSMAQEATLAMSMSMSTSRELLDEDKVKSPSTPHTRPAPLNLIQQTAHSPLLNTTWGSPLSSPDYTGSMKSSSTFYTPVPGNVNVGVGGGRGVGFGFGGGGGVVSPTLGMGGFASAMRQRLEEERVSPNPNPEADGDERRRFGFGVHDEMDANRDGHDREQENIEGEVQVESVGHRIVIEDEDELPSRIQNSTFHDDSLSPTTSSSRSGSSSPEPELLLGKHLAPLVVTNRTPSPSINEGASDEGGGGLSSRLRMLDDTDGSSKPASRMGTPPPSPGLGLGPLPRISEPPSNTSPLINPSISDPPLPPSTPPSKTSVDLSPSLSPSLSLSTSPSPSHLRPSLRELREGGMVTVPGTNQRRSLFLPHPNAPKAPPLGVGPDGVAASGVRGPYIAAQPVSLGQQGHMGVGLGQGQGQGGLHPPPATMMGSSGYSQSQQQPQQQQQHPHPNNAWIPPPSQLQQQQQQQQQPRPNVLGVIRMALSLPPAPRGALPPGPPSAPRTTGMGMPTMTMPLRGPTIYGRTEVDLGSSIGPVPIVWSVEPPAAKKATAPPPSASTLTLSSGAGGQQVSVSVSPPRVQMMAKNQGQVHAQATRSKSLGAGVGVVAGVGVGAEKGGMPATATATATATSPETKSPSQQLKGQGTSTSTLTLVTATEQKAAGGVIPRANFFPNKGAPGGLRPRSRSFSGFNLTRVDAGAGAGGAVLRSREDSEIPSASDVKRSLTTSVSAPSPSSLTSPSSFSSSSSSSSTSPPSSSKLSLSSSPLRPSPLSLSSVSLKPTSISPALKSPSSPLAQSITAPRPTSPPTSLNGNGNPPPSPSLSFGSSLNLRPLHQLRQASSRSTLNEDVSSASFRSGGGGGVSRTTMPAAPSSNVSISSPPQPLFASTSSPGRTASLQVLPRRDRERDVASSSSHADPDAISLHSTRSQLVSPPPTIVRQTSLRSKLSLPNLRRKQSKNDEESTTTTLASSPPNTHTNTNTNTNTNIIESAAELLQVQDMEFELVRPSLSHFTAAARTSEDSGVLARENSLDSKVDSGGGGGAGGFLRPSSPAASTLSSVGGRSDHRSLTTESYIPSTASTTSPIPGSNPKSNTDAESSMMDAHRQRELKWMSHMSSNAASQARKSKKVRKLVVDGVPSSVRYLVWSYLTDGKARCVPGVYSQLAGRGLGGKGKGGKVSVSMDIERDIRMCFQDQPHLQGTKGPVLLLLQAYLNMVPDVVYSRDLTLIVGQLLLLSPEEDAFWIFVSVMDTHIRSYFSSSTTQMEVDAALFSRALEVNDNVVAKKLFVDLGILPVAICRPWFSSLFVRTLPPEYVNRVWDMFLFEGVPFLIRVALSLITCCRRKLLDSTSEESVLQTLSHPPQAWLPASPDGLLALAFGVKLKDDDVRKQRVKMEAQIKRQTQAQVPRVASSTSGMISLPRA